MSVRGGIGLFYENVLTIVAPLDPLYRAPVGDVFLQSPIACNGTATPQPVPISGGALEPTFCSAMAGYIYWGSWRWGRWGLWVASGSAGISRFSTLSTSAKDDLLRLATEAMSRLLLRDLS